MQIQFHKYQGTGNDFILIDNRDESVKLDKDQIAFLCHRRFGIGADGLMLLENAPGADFRMVYFNSDGAESSMCGNGGRCITAFAKSLGIIVNRAHFLAIDGMHEASVSEDGMVSLKMKDVSEINSQPDHAVLDTGSPHYVQWVHDTAAVDVVSTGRNIRYQPRFAPGGLNVNFAHKISDSELKVRTYERGVEDETLSCGTGVTAAAIAASGDATGLFVTNVHTPGGLLQVSFEKSEPGQAQDVILQGPAVFVFKGEIELPQY